MKVMNITTDPDMKASSSVCLQQLSPNRMAPAGIDCCPQTTKALHETAVRPTRHFLQSSASQPSIHLKSNVNKSMVCSKELANTTNCTVTNPTNSSQSVERAKSNLNASSAFIEAYLVRKPQKFTTKLVNEPSIGEWSSSHQDGKSSVKMIKKGNTFFPAIFKSPTGTGSNK